MEYENGIMKVEEYDVLVVEKKMKEDFETIEEFSEEGYAMVSIGDRKGVINANGELIIPCEYSFVSIFGKYALVGNIYGPCGAIDLETKKKVLQCNHKKIVKISGKYAVVANENNDLKDLVDLETGKTILEGFLNATNLHEDRIAVQMSEKVWKLMNLKTQQEVIEREYITNFNDADVSINSYLKNPTRKMEVYSKKGLSVNGHMVVFENELERMEYLSMHSVGPTKVYKNPS